MNIQQKGDMKSFEQTLLFLSQNAAQTALLPNGAALISAIDANIATLYVIDTELQGLNKLNVLSKAQQRIALETVVFQLAARGTAYAVQTNNALLEQSLTTVISDLRKMSEVTFRDYAQHIYNTLNAEIANIDAIYRITAADLTNLQTQINDYTDTLPGASNRIARIKTLNAQFADVLTNTKVIGKKLDGLIDTLRFDEPFFYKGYTFARKPKKASSSVRALVFTVTNSITTLPLYKVTLTFTPVGGGKTIIKRTTKNGTIVIPNLAEGVYEGSATEAGYFKADYTISVHSGSTATRAIALVPDASANSNMRR